MILLKLFYEFFLIGFFAIGGGLATLPFLNELGIRTGWFTSGELADILAVSESTPGPIGVNMATYVGYKVVGIPGAAIATVALILPSIIIALIIIKILKRFSGNRFVIGTLYGLRPASMGLIGAAAAYVMLATFFYETPSVSNIMEISINYKALILAVIVSVFAIFIKKTKNIHPIIYIMVSAIIGIIFEFSL